MKRILICDDHPTIRKGAKMILSDEFSEVEFGEASSAAEALKKVHEKKWDVLILDMDMPGRSGLDVLRQLKSENIKFPVLMFSMHPEEQVAIRAIRAGASGYLAKDSAEKELANAVHTVLSGRKFITASLAEQLAMHLDDSSDKAPHELLSDREYQTLLLIASGKTVSQIAEQLSLAVSTVSSFRAHILEKMNMKNNSELIKYALDNKLV